MGSIFGKNERNVDRWGIVMPFLKVYLERVDFT